MMSVRRIIESKYDISRWIGDEAIVSCPHPDHEDRNPSAAINVKKRLWTCYSCGRGGSLDQLLGQALSDPDVDDILKDIASSLEGMDADQKIYPESWLDQFDFGGVHKYWIRRGVSEKVAREFRLGYDFESRHVTYPLRSPLGEVLGVVKRVLGNERPKYQYPDHASVSKTLFAYYKTRHGANDIVVTEGALDALAFWDVGIPAVAQLGSSLSAHQAELIAKLMPTSITLAYDMDNAGTRAVRHTLGNSLISAFPTRVMRWDPSLGKDPLDLDQVERLRQYERAELV